MFWQIKPHRIICRGNQKFKRELISVLVLLEQFYKIYNATILFYYEEFDQYRDAFKRENN
jgi:hypothetical protein